MKKNSTARLVPAPKPVDVSARLAAVEQKFYDVDAVLAIFKESLEDEVLDLGTTGLVDPTRPVDLVRRELDALRNEIAELSRQTANPLAESV